MARISESIGNLRSGVRSAALRSPLRKQVAKRYWVVNEGQPVQPRPVSEFRMFGILGTWMEEDIVAACVSNALAQGCEEVFLVDNSSTDSTVEVAEAAGASLIADFTSPFYDEYLRIHHMQSAVEYVTMRSGANHVWWLWLDADEFPVGPDPALHIRDYVAQLDSRFTVVGARYFEHFPNRPIPETISGDPLSLIPLCVEHAEGPCFLKHRKHPLVRFDKGHHVPRMGAGFHRIDNMRGMIEPSTAIKIHHFPYRSELRTRDRLEMLCGEVGDDSRVRMHEEIQLGQESNSSRRFRELEAVYDQRWPDVELLRRFGAPKECDT